MRLCAQLLSCNWSESKQTYSTSMPDGLRGKEPLTNSILRFSLMAPLNAENNFCPFITFAVANLACWADSG